MRTSIVDTPGTLRPLLRLVWPVLAEQVLVMLVGFSDTLLAGYYLTPAHLAAMTLIAYALWLLTNLFAFVSLGTLAMVARFVGAGDWPMANRVTNQSFVLGAIFAVVVTTAGIAFGGYLPELLQLEGQPADLARRYLRFLFPMLPLIMAESVGIACLRGAGDMVTGMVAMILVNVVNIAVAWSLLLGVGPLPALGWDALPIGTACGHAVGGLVPLMMLLRGRAGLRIQRAMLHADRNLMRRILRIGIPGGIDIMSIIALQFTFLAIVDRLGTVAVAAHGVAIRLESLAYLPGYAFEVAAATLVGQYLGAGNHKRASRAVVTACATSGGLLGGIGVVLFFAAPQLVNLIFGPEQGDVAAVAPSLLRIIAFGLVPLALCQVLIGALRGAGDTRWPLAFTFIGFLGVRLPMTYVLAITWGWGIQGAWYAMVADLTSRCILVSIRFAQGGWQRIEV